MSPTRIVRVGRERQLVTTSYTPNAGAKGGVHEHVTLSTPAPLTDTARLRLVSVTEKGKRWPR